MQVKLQVITGMKEYENKSCEELRCEDYLAGRKSGATGAAAAPSTGGLFGSTTPVSSSNTFGAFGATNNATTNNTGGLFGSNNNNTSNVTTGGLFGSTTTNKVCLGVLLQTRYVCLGIEFESKSGRCRRLKGQI